MTAPSRPRPLVLSILAGFGERAESDGNAVRLATTPTLDALADYPRTLLGASGADVGLPKNQPGSGAVGLRSLGAGRVPVSSLARVDAAIADKSIRANPVIAGALKIAKHHFEARLHVFCLLSDGGVHASINHLFSIIDAAAFDDIPVVVHAFLDGRDAAPKSAGTYLDRLENFLDRGKKGVIGTVSGRHYAMDREQRWERTALVYKAIVRGQAPKAETWYEAVSRTHGQGKSDALVEPVRIGEYSGMKGNFMCDFNGKDRLWRWFGEENALALNLRPDGLRQLSAMLLRKNVPPEVEEGTLTDRGKPVIACMENVYASLTVQDPAWALHVAFPQDAVPGSFGEAIAAAGLTQLRCAESARAPHATSFFSGQEAPFMGEERAIVPSPRDVETPDRRPETSAAEVARRAVEAIESRNYDFILVDFAGADLVAHTGNLDATTRAVQAVDAGLGAVLGAVRAAGGALFVTSDHGNCEQMKDAKGQPNPAHTTHPVPLYYVNDADRGVALSGGGRLADVAPTMLELLGVSPPEAMTGRSLFAR